MNTKLKLEVSTLLKIQEYSKLLKSDFIKIEPDRILGFNSNFITRAIDIEPDETLYPFINSKIDSLELASFIKATLPMAENWAIDGKVIYESQSKNFIHLLYHNTTIQDNMFFDIQLKNFHLNEEFMGINKAPAGYGAKLIVLETESAHHGRNKYPMYIYPNIIPMVKADVLNLNIHNYEYGFLTRFDCIKKKNPLVKTFINFIDLIKK